MKTLLPTFAFLGLVAAIIEVASCCTKTIPPNQNVEMILGDPNANPPKYVELKPGAEGKLRHALAKIKAHNGICEITFLGYAQGTPDPHYFETIGARLKTARFIKLEAATNARPANSP